MTKKDYIKLASIVAEYYPLLVMERWQKRFVNDIIKWLKEDSDRFDEEKFKKAVYKK